MAQMQYDWYVRLPDKPDALQARRDNRPAHLDNITRQIKAGQITMRGDILLDTLAGAGDEHDNVIGSVHAVKASNEEEVWQLVKADPYAKLGVWDLNRATVSSMKVGIMKPL